MAVAFEAGSNVAVASLEAGGSVVWRPVNACILFLGMLEGASITTIEGLSDGAGGLHPCQQAMVDFHASQCGFCTPGMIIATNTLAREA